MPICGLLAARRSARRRAVPTRPAAPQPRGSWSTGCNTSRRPRRLPITGRKVVTMQSCAPQLQCDLLAGRHRITSLIALWLGQRTDRNNPDLLMPVWAQEAHFDKTADHTNRRFRTANKLLASSKPLIMRHLKKRSPQKQWLQSYIGIIRTSGIITAARPLATISAMAAPRGAVRARWIAALWYQCDVHGLARV